MNIPESRAYMNRHFCLSAKKLVICATVKLTDFGIYSAVTLANSNSNRRRPSPCLLAVHRSEANACRDREGRGLVEESAPAISRT